MIIEKVNLPHQEPNKEQGLVRSPLRDRGFDFVQETSFRRGPFSPRNRKRILWSLAAATIDALTLFSLACFFLVVTNGFLGVSISAVFRFAQTQPQIPVVITTLSIFFFMVIQRVFLGFSLGEWACGLRLGHLNQRLGRFYALKVVFRMSLIAGSGFILLPILSVLSGWDVAGLLSKLPLVEKIEKVEKLEKAPAKKPDLNFPTSKD
jgi:hypothetical protein